MQALAQFMRENQKQILSSWEQCVAERHALGGESRPQLLDDMPELIEEIIEGLNEPAKKASLPSARAHASQRLELGADIDRLCQEFGILGETILALLTRHDVRPPLNEIGHLWRLIGHGTASSVARYAELANQKLREQAAQEYSFIAHDLRTPLMTAKLCVDILSAMTGRPAELDDVLGQLRRAHAHLGEQIDNSLVRARLSMTEEPQREQVRLADLIEEVADQSRAIAENKQINIELQLDRSLDAEGDPKLLASALANLVTNGIKFSLAGGVVDVRSYRSGSRAVIDVTDSCGGMHADLPERLFKANVQGRGDHSGFGLGLAIAREVVDAHDGTIAVRDVPGRGCCFTVELPVSR